MRISVITLFPEIFPPILGHSILKRAQEKGLIEYVVINHRDFGIGPHKVVDDRPYGGGAGMVLRVDVMEKAITAAKQGIQGEVVILLDPKGTPYTQEVAEDLSKLEHIVLVSGHYEGFDERIRDLVDMEISIGDYVLTGGEIPAMVILDSVTRLIPGVLKDETATKFESHSKSGMDRILEGPHYTRPDEYNGKKVPQELLSGDPKIVEKFRKEEAQKMTKSRRPDLLKSY